MDAVEAGGLCWILGSAGWVAAGTVQGLYWWQAKDVPAGRGSFFLRSILWLIPTLLLCLYCLLHATPTTPYAPLSSLTQSQPQPQLQSASLSAAHTVSASSSLPSLSSSSPPEQGARGVEILPHSALLGASLASAVSLAGLALCLLPSAEAPIRNQAWRAVGIAAASVLLLLALLSLGSLPFSATGPGASGLSAVGLLAPLSAASLVLFPGYHVASSLNLMTCRGYAYAGSSSVGAGELARSLVWAAYGASSGDAWIAGAFSLCALLEAFVLLVGWFVDYTKAMGSGSYSHNKKTTPFGEDVPLSAEGYEMVPSADFESVRHSVLPSNATSLSSDSQPGTLNLDNIEEIFDEWLQKDVFLGRHTS